MSKWHINFIILFPMFVFFNKKRNYEIDLTMYLFEYKNKYLVFPSNPCPPLALNNIKFLFILKNGLIANEARYNNKNFKYFI